MRLLRCTSEERLDECLNDRVAKSAESNEVLVRTRVIIRGMIERQPETRLYKTDHSPSFGN
jgi:hypothetical protein